VARLDRFLQVVRDHHAHGLRLAAGQAASLLVNGSVRPVTREALTSAQIAALLREIAPPAVQPALGQRDVTFAYDSPHGPVHVEVTGAPHDLQATLRPGAAPAVAAGAEGGAAPRPAPPPPGLAAGGGGARVDMERLLRLTFEQGASDLHLRTGEPAILRQDGDLLRVEGPALDAATVEALLSSIMTDRERAEFKEHGDVDWAFEVPGMARFRCNAGLERRGPMGVLRVIPSQIRMVEELGLSAEIQKLCFLTKGLVLVTGPTGSGKSTTLAALVDLMNRTRSDHILTIEDPIEFVHQPKQCLVTQRQVGLHSRSFKTALRAALREDPDIILVGEMRDLETISIALETAETGHLVFGTLHTTTAASTVDRIIDQFPADRQSQIRVMLADSLKGVIAQVLCRKIGGGRVAAHEVLLSIPAISNLIREGKTFQIPSIMQTNRKAGMVMLNDALLDLVERQVVEPREAYLRAVDKAAFASALRARRFDTSFLGDS
jgi:twitching motility protein PilT